jgi:hypothetical protein
VGFDVGDELFEMGDHVRESMEVGVNGERIDAGSTAIVEVIELSLVVLLIHHLGIFVPGMVERLFDEQHRRDVVAVPANRDFHDIRLLAVLVRCRPRIRISIVVDFLPAIALSHVSRFELPFHETAIVEKIVLFHEIGRVLAELPPACPVADRLLAGQLLHEID